MAAVGAKAKCNERRMCILLGECKKCDDSITQPCAAVRLVCYSCPDALLASGPTCIVVVVDLPHVILCSSAA